MVEVVVRHLGDRDHQHDDQHGGEIVGRGCLPPEPGARGTEEAAEAGGGGARSTAAVSSINILQH